MYVMKTYCRMKKCLKRDIAYDEWVMQNGFVANPGDGKEFKKENNALSYARRMVKRMTVYGTVMVATVSGVYSDDKLVVYTSVGEESQEI